MSLKTIRVCDICKGETPEMQTYIRVRVNKVTPAIGVAPLDNIDLEVCSGVCALAVMEGWVAEHVKEALR